MYVEHRASRGEWFGLPLRYVPKYGRLFCASILCLVVESVCDLLQPTIMARIVMWVWLTAILAWW